MPIVYQKDAGLNRGILGGASALSEALSGIGQQRRQEELRQKLKYDEEQKQAKQNTILSEAIKDLGADSSDLQWASALSKAIGQGLSPEYAKPLIELQKAFKPTASTGSNGIDINDRSTYNQNLKFLHGIYSDAQKAESLLKDAENVIQAIKSKNLPGSGVQGSIREYWNEFFNKTPKEVQTIKSIAKKTIIEMGDTKGIRLTNEKLKFLQDNLFNERKSPEQNEEAFRIWKNLLTDYSNYRKVASNLILSDKNSLYSPLFENNVLENAELLRDGDQVQESVQENIVDTLPPASKVKKGAIARNSETGEIEYIFNGKNWVKQ